MTHVLFYLDNKGKYIGFRSEGHSNYGEYGKDIVCAAVSMICQSTMFGIEHVAKAKCIPKIDSNKALMSIAVVQDKGIKLEYAEVLLKTMEGVIKGLVDQYPDHVTLAYA